MSFDKSNKSSSNEDYLGFTDNKSNSENEEDSVSTSSQFCPLSELPLGHRISFLENGASEGCQWLLLYSVNSYGQYLVPKNLIPKPALKVLLENNGTKMVPEELNFVCEFIDHEKYHRKWAPYIPLCFTYFIGEALRVHDLVDDEDPNHVCEDVAFRVLLQYYFVDYYMAKSPRSKITEVWKLWDLFSIEWKKNPKINLEEQMVFAKDHVNDLMTNTTNSLPELIEPMLYPWDFVNRYRPFDCVKCPFSDE